MDEFMELSSFQGFQAGSHVNIGAPSEFRTLGSGYYNILSKCQAWLRCPQAGAVVLLTTY
jgi:hypothetical protein